MECFELNQYGEDFFPGLKENGMKRSMQRRIPLVINEADADGSFEEPEDQLDSDQSCLVSCTIWNASRVVNHLSLFIPTGRVGGIGKVGLPVGVVGIEITKSHSFSAWRL